MDAISKMITESELEVMDVLWEAGAPLTITQIRRTLEERIGWESTTIKTLVQRLCKKGAVLQEKRDVFYYTPAIERESYNQWATGNLIRRLYRGRAGDLVAALVRSDGLTQEDLEELRAILKKGADNG